MKIFDQNIHNTVNPINIRFKADAQKSNTVYEEEIELPDMYYMPENYKKTKTFKDVVKKIDLMGLIHPWFEHPLLMLATCAGLSTGIDAFDKSCNKEYEKSIVGRAAKFGDKIEKSKYLQNETSQKTLSSIKKGWKKIKNTAMKNDVINAMITTPSKPEWSAPKDELKHTNYRIVNKFKELVGLMDMAPSLGSGENAVRRNFSLKDLALDNNEIEELKNFYKVERLSQAPQEEIPYRVLLKRIGKSEQEIADVLSKSNVPESVANELFKKSGLTREEFEAILHDENGETIGLVKKASKNLRGTKINNGKILLPGTRQPFANIEGFEGIYNRAYSLTDGAKTKTGRFMSKLVQKIHRGFTFGGRKTGVMLWVTPFLAETVINTIKADWDEKLGTAVSGLANAVTWVFTFPIALKAIHAFGGIQYAGMGKEKVEEYEKLIKEFNAKTDLDNPEHFKSYREYRNAKRDLKKILKDKRKVKNQNFLTGTLRGISKFSKADLLKLESFKNGSPVQDFARKLPNLIKDYVIYAPGRMILFMVVGVGLADKIINKAISKVFGKAYDGMKDEDMESEKEKQEEYSINNLRARLVEIEKDKLYPKNETTQAISSANKKIIEQAIPESMLELAALNSSDSELSQNIEPQHDEEIQEENPLTNNIIDISENEVQPNNKIVPDTIESEDIMPIAAGKIEPEDAEFTVVNETATEDKEQNSENTPEQESFSIMPTPVNKKAENILPILTPETKKYDNYTYIPSSENILGKDNPIIQTNKYIPSQTGITLNKYFDNSALEAAIRRSNRAEKRALRILAGNFDDIG